MKAFSQHFFLGMALFLAAGLPLFAQSSGLGISGKVVDARSGQPIEFATVMAISQQDSQTVAGATTNAEGAFRLRLKPADVYFLVKFIGFLDQEITDFEVRNGAVNLGTIRLEQNKEVMQDVLVEGERSTTEFMLDKRVFNVGQDLSTTGASALEVLDRVPSVNVSIEGEVSLRGTQGVQILINGKPSVLASDESNALGTITADMIERIEVITNPSAKYQAEGTAGIINIVLKKEEKKGTNGSFSVNTGTPHNHSIGFSLNHRTERFNLFTQGGVGYRELPRNLRSVNQNLLTDTTIFSEGTQYRNEQFYNITLGADYHLNTLNIITLSGSFAYEIEDQPSAFDFSLENAAGLTASRWRREETTEATNPKLQFDLQYQKQFEDNEDHKLELSAQGNFFGKDQSSEFENTTVEGTADQDARQLTATQFQEGRYIFMADYAKPFSKQWTLEAGAQYEIQDVSNDFSVSNLQNGIWVNDPNFTNLFEYDQSVIGAYGTGAYEGDKWGVKFGLRLENTDLQTLLVNTGESNPQNYTNLFPSAHISYKLSKTFSLQGSYSRRIYRPRLWDLNPFFNIRNNFSIRAGNPNLLPEFTDSYELAGIYTLGKTFWNFALYHRYTTAVIERVSVFENNVNTIMPMNIGSRHATGFEFNTRYDPTKWLSLSGDFNLNYFQREGQLSERTFDFSAQQWNTKINAKLKLPKDLDLEATANYQSGVETVQGRERGILFADFGVRKKILKRKGVVSLSVRDVFASRIRISEAIQSDFYLYNYRFSARFIRLGFSYSFGKGEAMEYTGRRR